MAADALGLVVPHQANLRIIEGLAKEMALTAPVFVNIHRYGNTGAATVPIALDEAVREGRLDPARPTLLVSFGAGATAGAAVLGVAGLSGTDARSVRREGRGRTASPGNAGG